MTLGERVGAAFDLAHSPPEDVGGIAVLFVAGDDAALAANALRHVEVKPVLFSGTWQRQFMTVRRDPAESSRAGIISGGCREECGVGLLHSLNEGKLHRAPCREVRLGYEELHSDKAAERGRVPLRFLGK